jgi:DNA-binding transcriptional LysR family regulator
MDQKQLQCFVAVAEELHFGRAADRLNMAQPPLSRHILNLEEQLGTRLFNRTSRSVDLTEFGAAFLQEVLPLVRRFEALPDFAQQLRAGTSGILHVGAVGPALDGPLPNILRRFQKSYPEIALRLHVLGTADQIDGIQRGRLHAGFIRPFFHDIGDLAFETVAREPYLLVAPKDHRFAKKKQIVLKDLDGENLVFFPRTTHPQLFDTILSALHDAGARVRVSQEADSKSMICAMAASGLGVGFIPKSSANSKSPDIVFVDIAPALPLVEIQAIWQSGSNLGTLTSFMDSFRSGL